MANCEFSETQFAFCYVNEMLNRYPHILMPIFPTLRQERKLGWDVRIDDDTEIDGSLFIQFKRPKFLSRTKKYKITITKHQFDILYILKKDKPANNVFYVAPIFHTLDEMKDHHINNEIEKNTAHFPLENFPSSLTKNHHGLTYEYDSMSDINTIPLTSGGSIPTDTYGIINSEPISIENKHCIDFDSIKPDRMKLIKKSQYLLNNVIPGNVVDAFDKIESPVEQLFSILLVRYNILWIPIKL